MFGKRAPISILMASVLVLCLAASARAPLPGGATTNIKIYSIEVKPDCALWVTYQNTGTTTITSTLREKTTVDGAVVENNLRGYDLAPGGFFAHEVGVNSQYKLYGVNKTVVAMVDVDNVLAESNESDNTMTKSMTCHMHMEPGQATAPIALGKPDLAPHLSFTVVTEGDDANGHYVTFNANITVTNVGSVGAGPFDVLLERRVNDQGPWLVCGLCKVHFSGVVAGQYVGPVARQFTKRGTQTSGQAFFFRLTADVDHTVTESNEDNNIYTAWYQSQPLHK